MNEITTLFTALGDFFTGSDWFQLVKWPFWILLFTVAAGGVYCARFGKKTLVNQGIAGCFSLAVIYLCAVCFYIRFPSLRTVFTPLPFLSLTSEGISLTDPFSLTLSSLAPMVLRLMILVFLVTLWDSLLIGGKTVVSWLLSQCLAIAVSLFCYAVTTAGVLSILPSALNRYAIVPVAIVVVIGILMLCAKFVFTVVITGGNPYFSTIYKFFTVNKGGSLFTVSAMSFVFALIVMTVMHATGHYALVYSSVNTNALLIVLGLLMLSLYIFSAFYIDRKKG